MKTTNKYNMDNKELLILFSNDIFIDDLDISEVSIYLIRESFKQACNFIREHILKRAIFKNIQKRTLLKGIATTLNDVNRNIHLYSMYEIRKIINNVKKDIFKIYQEEGNITKDEIKQYMIKDMIDLFDSFVKEHIIINGHGMSDFFNNGEKSIEAIGKKHITKETFYYIERCLYEIMECMSYCEGIVFDKINIYYVYKEIVLKELEKRIKKVC